MKSESTKPIVLPSDIILPIQRQPDGEALLLHYTGGYRASQKSDSSWLIEPIQNNRIPSAIGFLSRYELDALAQKLGITPIAFQRLSWMNGGYYSTWLPIVPKRTNHFRGPADLWASISSNLKKARVSAPLSAMSNPNKKQIARLFDAYTPEEALARHMSYSLRSMDVSIGEIVNFYNEQLVNLSTNNKFSDQKTSSISDILLTTHIHSFFLHLGAARDYLGAYLALKIGMDTSKVDDMARLVDKLRPNSFGIDPVLDQLKEKGLLTPKPQTREKWQLGGWLKEASDFRRQFVHKRPYGIKFSESYGKLIPIDQSAGLYRYFRLIHVGDDNEHDVLDVIVYHYRQCTEMFQDAAEKSQFDYGISTLKDAEIIPVKITK